MKRLILFELIILFLATTFESDSPPGWFQQVLPVNDQINDIFFLDSLAGWVVTQGGNTDTSRIMKTTNGGVNWTIQLDSLFNLAVIQFVDVNTGYAAGGNGRGKFLKTTNGGNFWTVTTPFGSSISDVKDIFYVDKDTGWFCSDDPFGGGIYKTTNGSLNWILQASSSYQPIKLFFINKDTGWAGSADNKIYRTDNSGLNWNLQMNFFSEDIVDIFFSSKDTGWIHGGATGIYRTTNGGSNWETQSTPLGYGNGKLYFVDSHHGWVGRSNGRMLVTNDGLTWGMQTTPAGSHFSVQMLDTLKGWAGTSNLIHTTDGGGPIIYTGIGINPNSGVVPSFNLKQNYPNPFNPTTNITFEVTRSSKISLKVFNILGEEIDELLDYEAHNTGTYTISYETDDDIPSGVYFYQITAWTENKKEIFIDSKKMLLIK